MGVAESGAQRSGESGALPLGHSPAIRAQNGPADGPFALCFRGIRCPSETNQVPIRPVFRLLQAGQFGSVSTA